MCPTLKILNQKCFKQEALSQKVCNQLSSINIKKGIKHYFTSILKVETIDSTGCSFFHFFYSKVVKKSHFSLRIDVTFLMTQTLVAY